LIDTDPYIPDTNGTQWYINQNQFYRQIRNFIIDLIEMPPSNAQDGQTYVPTGIYWQVAQATSLQNIDFVMRVSESSDDTTAVGIFMENVSHQAVIV
jgi:glucan 1,3-beta-glucosidase